ncbi:hypothetical protein ACFQAT_26865 [Undibacterium arcticum]|uniref:Integrase n=1 Tax=Undibacterium arcticum TaxID=1762892 RepID=A0ABV7F4W2_9BURK
MVLDDKQKPLKAVRDKVLLLIGFAEAFRRSELVALGYEGATRHAATPAPKLLALLRAGTTAQGYPTA